MAEKEVTVTDGPALHRRIAVAAERPGVQTSDVVILRPSQIDSSGEVAPGGAAITDKGLKR